MIEDFVDVTELHEGDLIIPQGLLFIITDSGCHLISASTLREDIYKKLFSSAIFLNKRFYKVKHRSDYVIDVFVNSKIYCVFCNTAKFKKISYV